MKKEMRFWLLIIVLLSMLLIPSVIADNSESGYVQDTVWTTGSIPQNTRLGYSPPRYGYIQNASNIQFTSIQNYQHVSSIQYKFSGSYSHSTIQDSDFTAYIGTDEIGTGSFYYWGDTYTGYWTVVYQFTSWNITGITGSQNVWFEFDDPSVYFIPASNSLQAFNDNLILQGVHYYYGGTCSFNHVASGSSMIFYYTQWENYYDFKDLGDFGEVTVARISQQPDSSTESRVIVSHGASEILNESYITGNSTCIVFKNPVQLTVDFSAPADLVTKQFNISNATWETPTPTPTPTPTATPTPESDYCGYWSLSLNTSNIVQTGAVLGTAIETDPGANFQVIDWYRVLPNGYESMYWHYVYDPGIFGLGAGWYKQAVNSANTTPVASSEAEAKTAVIQFDTAGSNYVRMKIYKDYSLIPTAYHDYDLTCTLDSIVYVNPTTQAENILRVSVQEADTGNLINGATVNAYNYGTGVWTNRTGTYGSTINYNVVPGDLYRFYVAMTGYQVYDQDYTIPAMPGIYPISLKRELTPIANMSYAGFRVRDASTYTGIMGAVISLSDGQKGTTLPSGYKSFQVNNSVTYYYSVQRVGYIGASGSFNIIADTDINVLLYPQVATTTPTTVPYWTETPTPVPTGTNPDGSPITAAPTPARTLSMAERTEKTTRAMDVWYQNAETISILLLFAVMMGALQIIGGNGRGRRKR